MDVVDSPHCSAFANVDAGQFSIRSSMCFKTLVSSVISHVPNPGLDEVVGTKDFDNSHIPCTIYHLPYALYHITYIFMYTHIYIYDIVELSARCKGPCGIFQTSGGLIWTQNSKLILISEVQPHKELPNL